MDKACYNCAKGISPDRTCLSDGNCAWWEPIDPVQEVVRVKRMLDGGLVPVEKAEEN